MTLNPGTVTLEWSCNVCGNIRRTDCTDITGSVYAFRPAGWVLTGAVPTCDRCAPVTGPLAPAPAHQHAEQMRSRVSGLRAGGASEPVADHGIRQPPQPSYPGGGGVPDNVLRDHEGKPLAIIGPGGGGGPGPMMEGTVTYSAGGGSAGPWSHTPLRTHGASGGQPADATASPSVPPSTGPRNMGPVGQASSQPEVSTHEYRPGGGNFVFVDTREGEQLGPKKETAGVPTLGSTTCVGCHHEINDGTTSGVAEAWRWATNPENGVDRGHPNCLARIGR